MESSSVKVPPGDRLYWTIPVNYMTSDIPHIIIIDYCPPCNCFSHNPNKK